MVSCSAAEEVAPVDCVFLFELDCPLNVFALRDDVGVVYVGGLEVGEDLFGFVDAPAGN